MRLTPSLFALLLQVTLTGHLGAQAQNGGAAGSKGGMPLEGVGHDRGVAVASNWAIEFLDFGCGYCAKFAAETFPTLDKEFVQTGRYRWKFVPFVIGMFRNSEEAAVAGECAAAQDKFLTMHDSIYASRKEWMGTSTPWKVLNRLARSTGLNADAFARCTRDKETREKVRLHSAIAQQANVRGTPSFFINGRAIPGAIPLPLFRQVLNELSVVQAAPAK